MQIQNSIVTDKVKFCTLLMGAAKSGKTTFASGASKPLLIDVWANLLSVTKKINSGKLHYVEPKTYDECVSLVNNNGGVLDPYDTIIIDSITFIDHKLLRPEAPGIINDIPSLRTWGYVVEKTYQLLLPLAAMANENKKNVILIGHERVIEHNDKPAQGRIDITGQLRERIPAMVDNVFRTDVVNNTYVVRTKPHDNLWMCGTQSDFGGSLASLEPFTYDSGFEPIMAKLRGQGAQQPVTAINEGETT